jgi:hypothetical protein
MRSPRQLVSRLLGRAGPRAGTRAGQVSYAPRRDGLPDPGEVVWAWVPYEEDARRVKDRPVKQLGSRGGQSLRQILTS